MKKSIFGVVVVSVVLLTGSAWGATDATTVCNEYAKDDGVSAEEMKDYMEQCLEDQRMASAANTPQAEDNENKASQPSD